VSSKESELRALVIKKTPFLEVLEYMKGRVEGRLGPVHFLGILQEEVGISFTKTREILEYFDRDMNSIAEPDVINDRWNVILENWESGE